METIKGVDDLFQMVSTNKTVDIAIMSVARDISPDYVDEDFIKEDVSSHTFIVGF